MCFTGKAVTEKARALALAFSVGVQGKYPIS